MKNIDSKLSNEWLDISVAQKLLKLLYFRKEYYIPRNGFKKSCKQNKKQRKSENFGILI